MYIIYMMQPKTISIDAKDGGSEIKMDRLHPYKKLMGKVQIGG